MSLQVSSPSIDINLHSVQGRLFQSQAQEILYGGAAGGGKSFLLRAAAIIWAMQIPGLQVYLFRRQFPDLEKNHMQGPTSFPLLLADLIDQGFVKWNATKFKFTFWNNAAIHLCHCQRDADRYNYLGAEMHVLLIDELSQFTPVVYKFLRTRVRMAGISVPSNVIGKFPRIVCGSNPGGPCHNYMKIGWVDIAQPFAVHRAPENDGGMMRQFIPARIKDNPTLEKEDPDYANRIRGLGDKQLIKAYLEGDFNVISGGMFDDLWTPDRHIITPFNIPRSWYIDRAFDWGSAKPFSVGWFAESDGSSVELPGVGTYKYPAGSIFQIGEWYGWNGEPDEGARLTDRQIAKGIKSIESQIALHVNPGPADNMIFNKENEDDISISEEMSSEGIDWTQSNKSPGSRKLGIQAIRTRLKNFTEERIELPVYGVFSNCTHTMRTLPVLQRGETDPEDIKAKQEDHVFDMTRYRLRHEKGVVTGGKWCPY